ncbi:TetR/AcrR family transcriptional regulator [Gordonia sp. IITR100]|uniref:TetR/AcrR family transcriptional regulator n=1 Tax=Gordonia sp. IITR100 TaxID=1314686 RepID=UPI0015956483|nr:TetR/AcrR family transcriptional regulator [Gordonia sp. IITR100]
MSKSADTASAKSARLPELRLEHLVREATRLFQEFGYRNVSMEQIGATVGLTGPALYRHFPSKQDILAQALTAQVRTVSRFMADAQERGGTPEEQIGLFFDALGDMTAHRDVSILWNRERLHLERSGLSELNRSFGGLVDTLAAKISAARPAVDPAGAELLATAVLSVYSSTARMRGSLSAKRLMQVQRALTDSILDCDLATAPVVVGTDDARSRRSPIARRERILDVATELFFVRGFRNVRIDEIAAHAGVSVATVYHEHAGKTEILWTVIRRGIEGLLGTSIAALDGASAGDTLHVLLRVFVDYSLGPNGRVLAVAVRDAVYLPEADQISRPHHLGLLRRVDHCHPRAYAQPVTGRCQGSGAGSGRVRRPRDLVPRAPLSARHRRAIEETGIRHPDTARSYLTVTVPSAAPRYSRDRLTREKRRTDPGASGAAPFSGRRWWQQGSDACSRQAQMHEPD